MTEEQEEHRRAVAKFEAAIEEFMAARGHEGGILVDWLLVTANHVEENGESWTANGIYGPVNQRVYQAAGLAEYAKVKIDMRIRHAGKPM